MFFFVGITHQGAESLLSIRQGVVPIVTIVGAVAERLVRRKPAPAKEERLSLACFDRIALVVFKGDWTLDLVRSRLGDGNSEFRFGHGALRLKG